MRILLNGRGGKVGSVLAPALDQAGHELVDELGEADATLDFTTPEVVVANVLLSVEAWCFADGDPARESAPPRERGSRPTTQATWLVPPAAGGCRRRRGITVAGQRRIHTGFAV